MLGAGDASRAARFLTDGDRLTPDPVARMLFLDAVTYLPDDILVKVDRAAMAVSLETRVPLLDHRVVEFAWRLPMAVQGATAARTKWLLRSVLDRYVPRRADRPAQDGLRRADRQLAARAAARLGRGLACPARLAREGYFDPEPIRASWQQHLAGQAQVALPALGRPDVSGVARP